MNLSHFREQRIELLARLHLGLGSKDHDEIKIYNYYKTIQKSKIKKSKL